MYKMISSMMNIIIFPRVKYTLCNNVASKNHLNGISIVYFIVYFIFSYFTSIFSKILAVQLL